MFNFYQYDYLNVQSAGLFISNDMAYEVYFKPSGEVITHVVDTNTGYVIAW